VSYALGQAKLLPGQIAFSTTPTGKLRSLQPLIEAGLPIAPYIEHGSWATGRPAIMRYGRDPYRGLGQDRAQEAVTEVVSETVRRTVAPGLMIGTGAVVGAAAGIAGGLLGKTILGGLLGAAGGGLMGYLAYKKFADVTVQPTTTEGLSGVLAVL
jgi:hypothetical protein